MANEAAIAELQAQVKKLTDRVDVGLGQLSFGYDAEGNANGDAALNVREGNVGWLVICGEARTPAARATSAHVLVAARLYV